MLSRLRAAQSRLASQLVISRGAKASTAKLPITLLEDVDHLGLKGQQVGVAHGYARNWLYPRQLAAPIPIKPRDRHQKAVKQQETGGADAASEDLQAVLSMLTSQPVVIQKSSEVEEGDTATIDAIIAAVRQQMNIELAPQLVNVTSPITAIGEHEAVLNMTLADGSKPVLKINLQLTAPAASEQQGTV